jgi:hypothetical protein
VAWVEARLEVAWVGCGGEDAASPRESTSSSPGFVILFFIYSFILIWEFGFVGTCFTE